MRHSDSPQKVLEASENGKLFDLNFKLSGNSATDLQITKLDLYAESGQEINARALEGRICRFNGKKMEAPGSAKKDKEWTIQFSTSANPNTANKHTIFVIGPNGEKVDASVKLSKDGKSLKIKPLSEYTPDTYTLFITEQLQSARGLPIKETVSMSFTVQ